jgi:hypothetical protein
MEPNRSGESCTEKMEGRELSLAEQSPFVKWLDNFWYHYKWPVIIVAFFVIVIAVCLLQQTGERKNDLNITYGGTHTFTLSDSEQMQAALSDALADDYDGDGVQYAGFVRFQIFSEEEIKAANDALDSELDEALGDDPNRPTVGNAVNLAYNAEQVRQLDQFVMTGESYIYICSPYVYQTLKARGNVRQLADLVEGAPAHAVDDCAILLKDTQWYAQHEVLQNLPEDTVVCLLGKSLFSTDDIYAQSVETFVSMIK